MKGKDGSRRKERERERERGRERGRGRKREKEHGARYGKFLQPRGPI